MPLRARKRPKVGARATADIKAALLLLKHELQGMEFDTHSYNILEYGLEAVVDYVKRYAGGRPRVLMVGINPGPYGQVQSGVPFGDVGSVTGFLQLTVDVNQPQTPHPSRPVYGLACPRAEVSGKRLWGFLHKRFAGDPLVMRRAVFVYNWCPIAFMTDSGANLTPDRLKPGDRDRLYGACDRCLLSILEVLDPELVVGVGGFIGKRLQAALEGGRRVAVVHHPSAMNPGSGVWATASALDQLVLHSHGTPSCPIDAYLDPPRTGQ